MERSSRTQVVINDMEGADAGAEKKRYLLGELEVAMDASAGVACVLRVLALIFTLAAAILDATSKQTKVVPIKVADTLPPLYVPLHAQWHYLSAYLYAMVANTIACAYAAVSLLLALGNKGKSSRKYYLGLLIFILDAIMVALLFSAVGAATAVGVLGYNGNSHVRWNKVCNVLGRFCHQMVATIGISFVGSLQFLLLLVVPLLRLHTRT